MFNIINLLKTITVVNGRAVWKILFGHTIHLTGSYDVILTLIVKKINKKKGTQLN